MTLEIKISNHILLIIHCSAFILKIYDAPQKVNIEFGHFQSSVAWKLSQKYKL